MKILSIDTSTIFGSVAVIDDDEVLAEEYYEAKSSHSEILLGTIDKVIKKAELKNINDIDGLAVAIGPGSFTGLRIGLSTAKGIAMGIDKPLVGVSTLEALTMYHLRGGTGSEGGILIPCIDAYRGEVYVLVPKLGKEMSVRPEILCEQLKNIDGEFCFVGDGAVRYKDIFERELGKRFKIAKDNNIRIAVQVARLGLDKIKRGDIPHVASLIPNYIRASDAELARHREPELAQATCPPYLRQGAGRRGRAS